MGVALEVNMQYPVVIHKDPDTDYGVTVPDLPGCFTAGDTVDQALEQLENIALVATDLNFLSGTTYVLTTKGRDFILERGWVSEK